MRPQRLYALYAVALAILVMLAGCDQTPMTEADDAEADTEALRVPVEAAAKSGQAIPGQYIVVFNDQVQDAPGLARQLNAAHGGDLLFTYEHALKGFAARLPEQAVEALGHNPNVAYVDPDGEVSIVGSQSPTPSWGLDRIDDRENLQDGEYTYNFDGTGVTAYILDTGIDYSHPDFGGRAQAGFNAYSSETCTWHWHGTHVAGTVGSATYGVAKNVALVDVRVLNCQGSGSYSSVISGVDYVTSQKQANPATPVVANMSLGGGASSSLNQALENSVAAGVTYAVSAGNENTDACTRSPASAPSALTVGSTTSSDARSSFSNYGTCVDLFAPGSSIRSTIPGGGSGSASGTSMASPHVAGTAALYLEANPGASPTEVNDALTSNATTGVVSNPGSGSPNLLLYSLFDGTPPPPPTIVQTDLSPVTVTGKKRRKGKVTVTVTQTDGSPVSGVTVNGQWEVVGHTPQQVSGVTGDDGTVLFTSSAYKANPSDFRFCVTSLGGNYEDSSLPKCSTPDDPPGGGAPPSNLTVTKTIKGRNTKAVLGWDGGGSLVDIWRGADSNSLSLYKQGINNSGSYTDNLGKDFTGQFWYKVCDAGTGDCTDAATW